MLLVKLCRNTFASKSESTATDEEEEDSDSPEHRTEKGFRHRNTPIPAKASGRERSEKVEKRQSCRDIAMEARTAICAHVSGASVRPSDTTGWCVVLRHPVRTLKPHQIHDPRFFEYFFYFFPIFVFSIFILAFCFQDQRFSTPWDASTFQITCSLSLHFVLVITLLRVPNVFRIFENTFLVSGNTNTCG